MAAWCPSRGAGTDCRPRGCGLVDRSVLAEVCAPGVPMTLPVSGPGAPRGERAFLKRRESPSTGPRTRPGKPGVLRTTLEVTVGQRSACADGQAKLPAERKSGPPPSLPHPSREDGGPGALLSVRPASPILLLRPEPHLPFLHPACWCPEGPPGGCPWLPLVGTAPLQRLGLPWARPHLAGFAAG